MINFRKISAGNLFSITAVLLIVFCFSSCARKAVFQNSYVVPAAKGDVRVTRDNNENYRIKIALHDLAEPTRLQPAKSTYVVWMVTDGGLTMNLGQINSSTGFLSNQLKANFETVSSSKPIKIFITAENDGSIIYPGGQQVLSTTSF